MQTPAVYSLTEIPYESVMLVAATFFLGWTKEVMGSSHHILNVLELGISRDGFHFSGFPQLNAPGYSPLVGLPAVQSPNNYVTWTKSALVNDTHAMLYWTETLGEAVPYANVPHQGVLRRDGFASVGQDCVDSGHSTGLLLTHLLELRHIRTSRATLQLRVNVKCVRGGELRTGMIRPLNSLNATPSRIAIDVQAEQKADCESPEIDFECLSRMMIPGFSLDESIPITGDSTDRVVLWSPAPVGIQPQTPQRHPPGFHLLFELRNCRLYSFWFDART